MAACSADREARRKRDAVRRISILVVLAGDTHNVWASDLATSDGMPVGVELATTAVSSPGLSRMFGVDTPEAAAVVERALSTLIEDVVYVNVLERGYLVVDFAPDEVRASWRFVTTVESRDYARSPRERTLSARPFPGNRRLPG